MQHLKTLDWFLSTLTFLDTLTAPPTHAGQFEKAIDAHQKDDHAATFDKLAPKMTPEQIAEAQRLATEWKPKKKQ